MTLASENVKRSQKAACDPERNIKKPVGLNFEGMPLITTVSYRNQSFESKRTIRKKVVIGLQKNLSHETCTHTPDLDPDTDPSIIEQKTTQNLNFNCFVTS